MHIRKREIRSKNVDKPPFPKQPIKQAVSEVNSANHREISLLESVSEVHPTPTGFPLPIPALTNPPQHSTALTRQTKDQHQP